MRDLLNPEDVFDIIGNNYSIRSFRALRIKAQIEAFRRMHIACCHEISLAGIYDCMPDLAIDGKTLMDAELKVEFEVARPNVEMMDAWRYAKKLNKLVAITSDMYLPVSYFNFHQKVKSTGFQPVSFS
jgi:predicted HAD superfamily hydrolase